MKKIFIGSIAMFFVDSVVEDLDEHGDFKDKK